MGKTKTIAKPKSDRSIMDYIPKEPVEYRPEKMTPTQLRAFYERSTGRAEVTDSPIDWFLGGGAAIDVGKGFWALGKIADNFKDEAASALVSSLSKTAAFGIPGVYGMKQFTDMMEKDEQTIKAKKEKEALDTKQALSKSSVKPIMAMGGIVKRKRYGMGGIIPAEVEGGEVIQTPDGQTQEVQGASHAQGGVDMDLPQGTKVFSDRLKIKGKTMAERKEARVKMMMKAINAAEKSKSGLAKNSLKRTMANLQKEEEMDLKFQEMLATPASGNRKEYAYGTGMYGVGIPEDYTRSLDFINVPPQRGYTVPGIPTPVLGSTKASDDFRIDTLIDPEIGNIEPLQTNLKKIDTTPTMGLTTGDMVGMAGTAFGAISQVANTVANARATKPNVNRYEGFNEAAIESNAAEMDNLGYSKAASLRDLGRRLSISSNAARNRNRGSATSMNTLRSLDLATDMASDEMGINATNQVEQNYLQQKGQLIGQKTQLLTQKDQMEMSGREKVDERDQADIDNLYSQFGANFAGISEATQSFAKNLNESKYRNDFLKILPSLNKYGIGYDAQGNMISSGTPSTTKTVKPASPSLFDPSMFADFGELGFTDMSGAGVTKRFFNRKR